MVKKIPSLQDLDLQGKTVILRVDLNSPIENKKIVMNDRIKQSADSIKQLQRKKAKVVVISHQGRPGKKDFTSLKQHSKLINKITKIKFVNDIIGKKAQKEIDNLKQGQAILLENVRTLKQEFNNKRNNPFVKILSKKADLYVNDAFSVSHRKQASITGFPKVLPSVIGLNFAKELEALDKIKSKNALYVLSGSKAEENLKVLEKNKKSKVLAGGLFGEMCLVSKGYKLGEKDQLFQDEKNNIKKLKKFPNVKNPTDLAIQVENKRKEISIKQLPTEYISYDIGKQTIEEFLKEIKKAKVIFVKGPLGVYEKKGFETGTKQVLTAIANSKAYTVLGGGHLTGALDKLKINKNKFNHVSLSGGAFISYISGEKLPGLEAVFNGKIFKQDFIRYIK